MYDHDNAVTFTIEGLEEEEEKEEEAPSCSLFFHVQSQFSVSC